METLYSFESPNGGGEREGLAAAVEGFGEGGVERAAGERAAEESSEAGGGFGGGRERGETEDVGSGLFKEAAGGGAIGGPGDDGLAGAGVVEEFGGDLDGVVALGDIEQEEDVGIGLGLGGLFAGGEAAINMEQAGGFELGAFGLRVDEGVGGGGTEENGLPVGGFHVTGLSEGGQSVKEVFGTAVGVERAGVEDDFRTGRTRLGGGRSDGGIEAVPEQMDF